MVVRRASPLSCRLVVSPVAVVVPPVALLPVAVLTPVVAVVPHVAILPLARVTRRPRFATSVLPHVAVLPLAVVVPPVAVVVPRRRPPPTLLYLFSPSLWISFVCLVLLIYRKIAKSPTPRDSVVFLSL